MELLLDKIALTTMTLARYGEVEFSLSKEPSCSKFKIRKTTDALLDTWSVVVVILKSPIKLMVQVVDWDFTANPKIYIKLPLSNKYQLLKWSAHFGPDLLKIGDDEYMQICYSPSDARSLPRQWPEKILAWAMDSTIKIISNTLKDANFRKNEIYRELVPTWNALWLLNTYLFDAKKHETFLRDVAVTNIPQTAISTAIWPVRCYISNTASLHFLNIKTESNNFARIFELRDLLYSTDGVIPLDAFLKFIRSVDKNLETYMLIAIGKYWIAQTRQKCLAFLLIAKDEMLLPFTIDLPTEFQNENLLQLFDKRSSLPLNILNVAPQKALNLTSKYIFNRNLENIMTHNLRTKNIALIGCGAIGGQLALSLARIGAGTDGGCLHLIDHDSFEEQNIGRHVLNITDLGTNKAIAVRDLIGSQFPMISVKALDRSILRVNFDELAQIDLLIDATGKIEVSEALNERYQNSINPTAKLLHVWIMANGEAVQGILAEHNSTYACRSCLQPSGGKFETEYDALLGHEAMEGLVACQSFTPFAISAALSAASLAVDMALDWANGKYSPRYRTRYNESWQGRKIEANNPSKIHSCTICNRAPMDHTNE